MKKLIGVLLALVMALAGLTACGSSEGGKEYSFTIVNTLDYSIAEITTRMESSFSDAHTLYEGIILPGASVEVSGTLPDNYARDWILYTYSDGAVYLVPTDGALSEIAQLVVYKDEGSGWVRGHFNAADKVMPVPEFLGDIIQCEFTVTNLSPHGIDKLWMQAAGQSDHIPIIREELDAGASIQVQMPLLDYPHGSWQVRWTDDQDDDITHNWEVCLPGYVREIFLLWDEQQEQFDVRFAYNEDAPQGILDNVIPNNPYVGTWAIAQGTLTIHEYFRWELKGYSTDEHDESGDYYFDDNGILTLSRPNGTYYEVTLDGDELYVEYNGNVSVFTREAA